MTTETKSLAELLPEEQARCRELLVEYKKIGPPGYFGAMIIEDALRRADQAVMQGDTVAMLRLYDELRGFE